MNPTFDNVITLGVRAKSLAIGHLLQDRLPEGALEQLDIDVSLLQSRVPHTMETRRALRASTDTERAALAHGYELVRGVRTLVRGSRAGQRVRKHYGVGAKCSPRVLFEVVSVLQHIINRAETETEEAQSLGVMPEDVTRMREALVAIHKADQQQRELKIESPKQTQLRQEAAQRVLEAVRRIGGAGVTRFANQPAAEEFRALLAASRRTPVSPATPGARSAGPVAAE
jgi:hypothetical protein